MAANTPQASQQVATESLAEILVVTATQQFGTVQLPSGDVFINNFQAILEEPHHIADMKALIKTGRVPHLSIKTHEAIEKEVIAEENRLQGLKALLTRSRPVVGMTSTSNIPTPGVSKA